MEAYERDEGIENSIKAIPQYSQVQCATNTQLEYLRMAANKLGLYDAADFIKKFLEANSSEIQRRFMVKGDHPVFARPDRVVSAIELESFKNELELAGYENIRVEEIKR